MMKTIQPQSLHLPQVTIPRWGWWLFVVAVAVLGCLPAIIVRFQIMATLDEFDATRVRDVGEMRPVHETYADAAQRTPAEDGRARDFGAGVLR